MSRFALLSAALLTTATLLGSGALYGAGGQNAYNNPTGDPATDTYQTPFANSGDGRTLIFCAEDEELVLTPEEGGAVEATCVPAEQAPSP